MVEVVWLRGCRRFEEVGIEERRLFGGFRWGEGWVFLEWRGGVRGVGGVGCLGVGRCCGSERRFDRWSWVRGCTREF